MRRQGWVTSLGVATLATGAILAGVVPGRWEKVETLENGTNLIIELKAGDRFNARLGDVYQDSLVVSRYSGDKLQLCKEDVSRVLLPARRDNKPIWLGAAIGGGAGAAIGLGVASQADETILAVPGAMGAILGGIGAAAGAGIGLAVRDDPEPEEVVYTSTP